MTVWEIVICSYLVGGLFIFIEAMIHKADTSVWRIGVYAVLWVPIVFIGIPLILMAIALDAAVKTSRPDDDD